MSKALISAAVLAVAALTSVSSFASSDSQSFTEQPTAQSTKTRAEVQAELQQAKRQGYVAMPTNHGYPGIAVQAQTKPLTRADVRATASVDRTLYN